MEAPIEKEASTAAPTLFPAVIPTIYSYKKSVKHTTTAATGKHQPTGNQDGAPQTQAMGTHLMVHKRADAPISLSKFGFREEG
jgi:hypothetical protein